jgi:formylmethanofuran dehydrogenase subunit A
MIAGCEACSLTAEMPFDYILDDLNGSDWSVTDYVLEVPIDQMLAVWRGDYREDAG